MENKPYNEAIKENKNEENSQEGSLLLERLRLRTPESIESFDINEDGLAIHGSDLSNLESILINGFDHSSKLGIQKENFLISVWYNIIGHPASRDGHQSKIGFGSENFRFGGQIIFVTDIFKKMWPNIMNGMVELPPVNSTEGVGGEIEVSNISESGFCDERCSINFLGINRHQCNWVDLEELPEPDSLLIPEFNKEKSYTNSKKYVDFKWVDTDKKKKTFDIEEPYDTEINQKAFRQLLSAKTLNAIVIPDKIPDSRPSKTSVGTDRTTESIVSTPSHEQILKYIISVQNKLFKKNEQIPVYNEQGKCLYNPLKS
jgi:hypothetical protein